MTGIGTILNIAGIILGGAAGLLWRKQLPPLKQVAIKGLIGVFTVYVGLRLTWLNINGSLNQVIKQLLIVVLALTLGRILGRLLHIQKAMNHAGQYAKKTMLAPAAAGTRPFSEGFLTCTLLFCLVPLGPLGALADGLNNYWQPLGLKALIDCLTAMALVEIFGWSVLASAIPVAAYQGIITLAALYFAPRLRDYMLLDSVNATAGLLIFCVALIILQLKKLELADYLPSLAFAPLITWLWK